MDARRALGTARRWCGDLLSVIYPHVCEVCGQTLVRGEELICVECDCNMPRVNLHREAFGDIHRKLICHADVERCAAWFYYVRDDAWARMVQSAKYNSRPQLARRLGSRYAAEIRPDGFFDGIDVILPVAMHRWKRMLRGYNQAEMIAEGVSEVTGIPVGDNLTMPRRHRTQTRRHAYERWVNTRGIFRVEHPEELADCHLLLVDDVLTTGATLTSAIDTIHAAAPTARISVLTLATTRSR